MPSLPPTDSELRAIAEAAYTYALVEALRDKHQLSADMPVEAMQSFLITAGAVYLKQKSDQEYHQPPSLLTAELRTIHKLASGLLERLERFPAHVHIFQQSRLMQQLPFGGLGPTQPDEFPNIEARYQPGAPEYELARRLDVVCAENNHSAVASIMVFAEAAMTAINTKEFSGRLSNLALNRWADNVRNFWTKGMHLPFAHSVEGAHATSPAANFCVDAMALLDREPTEANIKTAVRYARDAAAAWQKKLNASRTGTPPTPEG